METARLAWMQLLLALHAKPMRRSSKTNAYAMMGSISMNPPRNVNPASATADAAATVLLQTNAQTAMSPRSLHLTAHASVLMDSSRTH